MHLNGGKLLESHLLVIKTYMYKNDEVTEGLCSYENLNSSGLSVPATWLSLYIYEYDNYFRTFSPKPLDQSKPNCMRSIHGRGVTKFHINGYGHITKMVAMSIYGKELKKSSPEPEVR